jgi:acyl-CoA synthetase (AMP-forming)/AMP-acid ligase II
MLAGAAAQSRDGLTFVDAREQEQVLSWGEVYGRARQVAAALMARGVGPGERVAIMLPTCPGFVDAFFGAALAGAVPVPLYPPVRLGRMDEFHRATARMLQAVQARIVVTDTRIRLLLGKAVEAARPPLGTVLAEELLDSAERPAERAVAPEALAMIQFSSGSTVDPKPVALTHGNLAWHSAMLKSRLPMEHLERPLGVSWLPLYHDMGLIGCLVFAAYHPGPLVLLPPEAFLARPGLWLRALSRHGGTISTAPNFAYALCLKRVSDAELEGVDLSRWVYALNGAEPVSASVLRRFAERFSRYGFDPASLMPVYGLSEASLGVTFSPRRSPARALGVDSVVLATEGRAREGQGRTLVSVGPPVPGVEVEVRDELGHEVADRQVGRVWVKGPSVMAGYHGNAEATAKALQGGWLDTGDLGFVDGGELFLCGRAKDLVIIRGANHSPQEFEDCLEGLEGLRAGCAVALGFVPQGEESEALLVLAEVVGEPSAKLEEAVVTAILERTGIRPHTVRLLEPGTLPRTSSGKMRRAEALRRFLSGELEPPKPVSAVRLATEMAKSALAYAKTRLTE